MNNRNDLILFAVREFDRKLDSCASACLQNDPVRNCVRISRPFIGWLRFGWKCKALQYLIPDGALRLRRDELFGRIFNKLLGFKITNVSIILLAEKCAGRATIQQIADGNR
ncbi:hypothetical protein [Burkholderia ubonensis]|nr:hypothetical protein [Burkholderia ubonensis]